MQYPIIKICLDKYLENNAKNINKHRLSFEQSKEILFKYVDEYKTIPTESTIYDNIKLGEWFSRQKNQNIRKGKIYMYDRLSTNLIIKAELDRYI